LAAQIERQHDAYDAAFTKSDVGTMAGFLHHDVVWYALDGTKHEGKASRSRIRGKPSMHPMATAAGSNSQYARIPLRRPMIGLPRVSCVITR
jgi:hypothetical protein